jgi:hypothetical protein
MSNVIKLDPNKKRPKDEAPKSNPARSNKIVFSGQPKSKAAGTALKVLEVIVVLGICTYLAVSCVK